MEAEKGISKTETYSHPDIQNMWLFCYSHTEAADGYWHSTSTSLPKADPVLARMLSPDNFVQLPQSTQGYNRYSYCLNNPLIYTDPSGEFIGTIFTAVWDFGTTIFTKGAIDPWNTSENRKEAWKNFDPTAEWSKTNKAWKIDKGLFVTDRNKSFGGRLWELASRFTWQLPQTIIGNAYSNVSNVFYNRVNSVNYYGGATILDVDNLIWDFD